MEEYSVAPAPWGSVRGRIKDNGVREFLGIPYGRAERFCAPEGVKWEGVREALDYGPKAVQLNILGEKKPGDSFSVLGSEDCLNLNVWTAAAEGEKLPVVVYVHGGAYQVGCNSVPARAGDKFMEQDRMVFVSVNYRLGVFGFLQLGEELGEKYRTSGNCGALDVLLALRWVRENISAFGGDAENITVFGISAGAKLLGSLLTLPEVQSTCKKAVLESGAMQSFRDVPTARGVAKRFEAHSGIAHETELLTMSAEKLALAQADFCDTPGSTCFFGPVLDDVVFPADWMERWEKGARWNGAAILGSGKRELCFTAEAASFPENKALTLENLFGDNAPQAQKAFDGLHAAPEQEREAWVQVLSDFMYRSYTDALAKKLTENGNRVWVYSFDRLPACHGMGFAFLMRQADLPGFGLQGEALEAGFALADTMRSFIRRFILTGAPAEDGVWPEYQDGNKMAFDINSRVEHRPEDSIAHIPPEAYRLAQ